MLEHLPHGVGEAMQHLRAGMGRTLFHDPGVADCASTLTLYSPAFGEGGSLEGRFTADGEGVSPPLAWNGGHPESACTVFVVEDADSPTPHPLVHLIAWTEGGERGAVAEGAYGPNTGEVRTGYNSFHRRGWLPPDPPPGHGPHRYLFQAFSVDREPDFASRPPHRDEVLRFLEAHTLAMGSVVGTYARP